MLIGQIVIYVTNGSKLMGLQTDIQMLASREPEV